MKKIFLLMAVTMIVGCAEVSNYLPSGGDNSSARAKMQSCMLSDAQSRLQAGTLFNDTIYNTAKDLASTCAKKLALESMGISQQSQSDAVNIINNLKNMSAQ
jgi:hypothetical protein